MHHPFKFGRGSDFHELRNILHYDTTVKVRSYSRDMYCQIILKYGLRYFSFTNFKIQPVI